MITWKCLEHGVIPADQVHLLAWDSPHGEETHDGCGTAVDWEAPDDETDRVSLTATTQGETR